MRISGKPLHLPLSLQGRSPKGPAMTNDLLLGIQTNGIRHTHADPMPSIDTRFAMVRDAGVFDYIDKTPAPDEVEQFMAARDKYGLPVRAGGWFYALGQD